MNSSLVSGTSSGPSRVAEKITFFDLTSIDIDIAIWIILGAAIVVIIFSAINERRKFGQQEPIFYQVLFYLYENTHLEIDKNWVPNKDERSFFPSMLSQAWRDYLSYLEHIDLVRILSNSKNEMRHVLLTSEGMKISHSMRMDERAQWHHSDIRALTFILALTAFAQVIVGAFPGQEFWGVHFLLIIMIGLTMYIVFLFNNKKPPVLRRRSRKSFYSSP